MKASSLLFWFTNSQQIQYWISERKNFPPQTCLAKNIPFRVQVGCIKKDKIYSIIYYSAQQYIKNGESNQSMVISILKPTAHALHNTCHINPFAHTFVHVCDVRGSTQKIPSCSSGAIQRLLSKAPHNISMLSHSLIHSTTHGTAIGGNLGFSVLPKDT